MKTLEIPIYQSQAHSLNMYFKPFNENGREPKTDEKFYERNKIMGLMKSFVDLFSRDFNVCMKCFNFLRKFALTFN